ncbi:MAG: beta-Ala-His dipeptidase [Erysipelotrichaceae bacterium]|nr:beta-Ala-His dipeptidase [Erysipelotrichaceae bacterium]
MTYILNHEGNPHLKFFEDIAAIPRGSYNEKGIADYICKFAEDHNLQYHRDNINNLLVRKPASPGYESHPPVCMQGHMDMVCEKVPGTKHDFTKDPIALRVVDEDWLMGTDTTLGGDDGVAVALMLAILDDDSLPHPELECIFTMGEEAGCIGSQAFDYSLIKSRKMIGLDGCTEGTSTVLTSGVILGNFYFPITYKKNQNPIYKLEATGLNAGHGGANMAKEQANAIKLIARSLKAIRNADIKYEIADICGGTITNAIAEECWVTIAAKESDAIEIKTIFESTFKDIQNEHKYSDPNMKCSFKEGDPTECVIESNLALNLVDYLFMVPTGCYMRSLQYIGLPIASRNLGTIRIKDGQAIIGYQFRATATSMLRDLFERGKMLAEIYNGTFELLTEYHGYDVEPYSPFFNLWNEVYKEYSGKDVEIEAVHYGTDTGTFLENIPDMDLIILSPILIDVHRPTERLSISSFNRSYQYLKTILERC